MFLRNRWYVGAWGREVGRNLTARRICGEPLLFYRTEAGRAVVMTDRCPHRMAQLSLGKLVGDGVQCGYHGITYGADGTCLRIPGQERAPSGTHARIYPAVERWGWIWVWMGAPAQADPTLIPDFHWLDQPGWTPTGATIRLEANYQLVSDNLMDLSHETFVHVNTIGNMAVAETPMQSSSHGDTVKVERFMRDCPAPPLFKKVCGFATNIDRTQIIEFNPPAYIVIDARAVPTGTNDQANGLEWRVLNAITPETETSSHYFWAVSRHFLQDDAAVTRLIHDQIEVTFAEDRVVLEAQQRMLEGHSLEERTINAHADGGATRSRAVVKRLIEAEHAAVPA